MKKLVLLLAVLLICGSCVACRADTRVENFSWEQALCDDLAGWRLYISNVSGEDWAFVPSVDNPENPLTLEYYEGMSEPYGLELTIAVPVGVVYNVFFIVRALDLTGNESDPSNEVTKSYFIPFPTTIAPTTSVPIDETPPEDPYNLIISMMYWQYQTITLDLT